MAAAPKVGLLKMAWNEIPDIVGGTFMALVGVGLTCAGLAIYKSKNGDNRKHKFDYVVVRSDDPRAKLAPADARPIKPVDPNAKSKSVC